MEDSSIMLKLMGNQEAAIMPKPMQYSRELPQHVSQRHATLRQRRVRETVDIDSPLLARRGVADAPLHLLEHVAVGRKGTPPELYDASIVEVADHSVAAQLAELTTMRLVRVWQWLQPPVGLHVHCEYRPRPLLRI